MKVCRRVWLHAILFQVLVWGILFNVWYYIPGGMAQSHTTAIHAIHARLSIQGQVHLTLDVKERLVDGDTTLHILVVR